MYSLILLPERDCAQCTRQQKRLWGCEDTPQQPLSFDDEVLDRCPRRPLLDRPEQLNQVFWLYRNFERGILPEDGGLHSQPHKLTQHFEVIDLAKAVANAEQQEREQRRARSRAQLQSKSG